MAKSLVFAAFVGALGCMEENMNADIQTCDGPGVDVGWTGVTPLGFSAEEALGMIVGVHEAHGVRLDVIVYRVVHHSRPGCIPHLEAFARISMHDETWRARLRVYDNDSSGITGQTVDGLSVVIVKNPLRVEIRRPRQETFDDVVVGWSEPVAVFASSP